MMARVLVYTYRSPFACTNHRGDKDLFEPELSRFFVEGASTLRTTDPRNASIFYVAACLVDYFFRVRNSANASRQLRAAEDLVLAQIDAIGFGHKPHILNALRCHTHHRRDERNHIVGAFPRLWASRRFLRFCTEAVHEPDDRRSIHMPYCPRPTSGIEINGDDANRKDGGASDATVRPTADASRRTHTMLRRARSTRVVFIGSHLFSRKRALQALHRQHNLTRKLVIINPFRRGGAPA